MFTKAGKTSFLSKLGLSAALAMMALSAYAAPPTTVVVAFPPGGPADTLARVVAKQLEGPLGSSVIVENKPGGNGAIAANYVKRAAPDGHTLFLSSAGAISINPMLYQHLTYNPEKDFAPIAMLVSTPEVLVVPATGHVKSVKDFLDLAKSKKEGVTLSSSGIGSMPHMAISLLRIATKANILHVPYKGAAPAIRDTVAAQVGGFFGDISGLLPFIQQHKLTAIGIAASKRSAKLPGVPTFDELGFNNVYASNWYGIFAPAGTPKNTIDALNKAMRIAMASADVKKYVATSGVEAAVDSPDEFAKTIQDDSKKWGALIKAENITVNE
ncbi:Bug family tripartite tricarboxylate transporter substrate binding protein [Paralcaligenes ureilyticus]|uniref:Tripartite-type tricarboxylate transporter receptor subunit TctC n=1 Tax=Paralcaligenes ureilyticus TaxID=627131 RepID=A0A4R3M1I1_9BURK|nr:tripartite tricarboxylate transporter substrate binding protein [Paralcaligenes ureilyticus]TCT06974.1 tripartite-type tricarboxylate transporter receptor subunit TctC [Paralcaligenes ureilyticus]